MDILVMMKEMKKMKIHRKIRKFRCEFADKLTSIHCLVKYYFYGFITDILWYSDEYIGITHNISILAYELAELYKEYYKVYSNKDDVPKHMY